MRHFILTVIMVFFAAFLAIGQQNSAQTEKLKAEADLLFEADAFAQAYPLYSQLVSLNPKDAELNFKFGTCTLFAGEPKETAIRHLNFAIQKGLEDARVYFYMGKALHLNYEFAKAIPFYQQYLSKKNPKDKNPLPAEQSIQMCREGGQLLTKVKDIVVLEKVNAELESFFRFYNLEEIGGKVLSIPEELRSKMDKKMDYQGVLYKNGESPEVFFSSYGEKGENGIDIFQAYILGDGSFSEPKRLPNTINTPEDEEFAYMHPDGSTFYFASKGHNSMGGYDIFKSIFDGSAQSFSSPENLDFAINTPDDDLFFVTDSAHQTAFFASGRNSSQGELHVYKVMVDGIPVQLMFVKGSFVNEKNSSQSAAKITIVDELSGTVITETQTDDFNGGYVLSFPKAGLYRLSLQVLGEPLIHEGVIELPAFDHAVALEQELKLVDDNGREKLVINNLFDRELNEDLAALSAEVLRQKAGLEVNANEERITQAKEIANPKKDINDAHLLAGLNADQDAATIKNELLQEKEEQLQTARAHGQRASRALAAAQESKEKVALNNAKAQTLAQDLDQLKGEAYFETFEEYTALVNEAELEEAKANDLMEVAKVLLQSAEDTKALAASLEQSAQEIDLSSNEEDVDALVAVLQTEKERRREGSDLLKNKIGDLSQLASNSEREVKSLENRSLSLEEEERSTQAKITSKKTALESAKKQRDKAQLAEELFQLESELEYIEEQGEKAKQQLNLKSEEGLRARQQSLLAQSLSNENPEPGEKVLVADEIQNFETELAQEKEQLAILQVDRDRKTEAIAEGPLKEALALNEITAIREKADAQSIELKPVNTIQAIYQAAQLELKDDPKPSPAKELVLAQNTKSSLVEQRNFLSALELNDPEEKASVAIELKAMDELIAVLDEDIAQSEEQTDTVKMNSTEALTFLKEYQPELAEEINQARNEDNLDFEKLSAARDAEDMIAQNIKSNQKQILASEDEAEMNQLLRENAAMKESLELLQESKALSLKATNINVQNKRLQLSNAESFPNENAKEQIQLLSNYKDFLANFEPKNEEESAEIAELLAENQAEIDGLGALELVNVSAEPKSTPELIVLAETESELIQQIDPEFPALDLNDNATVADLNELELKTSIEQHENLVSKAQMKMDERVFAIDASTSTEEKERLQLEITRLQSLINRKSQEQLKLIAALDKLPLENETLALSAETENQDETNGNVANENSVSNSDAIGGQDEGTLADATASEEKLNQDAEKQREIELENENTESGNDENVALALPEDRSSKALADWSELSKVEQFEAAFVNLYETEVQTNSTIQGHSQFDDLSTDVEAAQFDKDLAEMEEKAAEIEVLESEIAQVESRREIKKLDKQIEKAFFDRSAAEIRTSEAMIVVAEQRFTDNEIKIVEEKRAQAPSLENAEWLALKVREKEQEAEGAQQLSREILAEAAPEIDEIKQAEMYKRAAILQMNALQLQNAALNLLKNSEQVASLDPEQIEQLKSGDRIEAEILAENFSSESEETNEELPSMNDGSEDALTPDGNVANDAVLNEREAEVLLAAEAEVNNEFPEIEVLAEEMEVTNPNDALLALELPESDRSKISDSEYFTPMLELDKEQLTLVSKRSALVKDRNGAQSAASSIRSEMLRVKQAAEMSTTAAEKDGLNAEFEQLKSEARVVYAQIETLDDEIESVEEEINEMEVAKASFIFDLDTAEILADGSGEDGEEKPEVVAIENSAIRAEINEANAFYYANNNRFEEYDFNFPKVLEAEVFNVVSESPYSEEQPIPINAALPEGIVYKVQVGAFRKDIPQNLYAQFAPVSGEESPSGLTRYAVGLFKAFTSADLAKKEVRSMGYKDAFVVAYKNGVRIPLYEARAESKDKGTETLAENAARSVEATRPEASLETNEAVAPAVLSPATANAIPSEMDWSQTTGSYYTVQVGVYSKQVDPTNLPGVNEVMVEQIKEGLFRYTSGKFTRLEEVNTAKEQIRAAGIQDAFVTAYRNGQKVAVSSITPSDDELETETAPEVRVDAPSETISYRVVFGTFKDKVPSDLARAMLSLERKHGVIQLTKGEETTYVSREFNSEEACQEVIKSYQALGVSVNEIQTLVNGKVGQQ